MSTAKLESDKNAGFLEFVGHTFLRVQGPDAERFLNGQLTADIRAATADRAMPSCCTDAKGRLNALLRVRRLTAAPGEAPAFLLDAPAPLRAALAARLEKYLIADDAEIADATEEFALLHAIAPGLAFPLALMELCQLPVASAERIAHGGHDFLVAPADAAAARSLLSEHLKEYNDGEATAVRIESGIPAWGAELDETTLPAEAGLDRTSVSFDKGCYIGQEVISRIESIGHPARLLRGFVVQEGNVAPGMTLHAPEAGALGTDRPIGLVTSVAHSVRVGTQIALGYLKWPADIPQAAAHNGCGAIAALLSLHPLPFRT